MKRYTVNVRWHGLRWTLTGIARDSATLVSGLIDYFGEGVFISVRAR